jgi:hypothetical protein
MLATEQPAVAPTISVVATTIEGTEAALVAAKQAAQERGARVSLLVPRIDSPAPPAERFVDTTNWLVARYEKVALDVGQPVKVRVCACRDAAAAAALLSPANSTVFVGGPVRRFWPSAEERLAARLRRTGRDVVFVGCNRREHHA